MRYLFIYLLLFCLLFSRAEAAILVLKPVSSQINLGDRFVVQVLLNTEGVLVNSFDLTISYDKSTLKFAGYKTDNTLNVFWITNPRETLRGLEFTGMIPGGVSGVYNPNNKNLGDLILTELIFQPIKKGETRIEIAKAQVLKSDGFGTQVPVSIRSTDLKISDPKSSSLEDKTDDTKPPFDFNVLLIPSQKDAGTPDMLYFEAKDDTAISGFFIKEKAEWQNINSPYQVKKPLLSKKIYLRVEDVAGNFTLANVVLPGKISLAWVGALIFVVLLAGFYLRKLLK